MTEQEQQIQSLTQRLVGEQIGELVLTCARLRAEAIVRDAAAAAERRGSPNGAQGADVSGDGVSHG